MATHRCGAMMEARDGLSLDDVLIHSYQGSCPEASCWYLTVHQYHGITDIRGIHFCPFCGEALDKEDDHA